jgi:hypothetical protein
VAPMGGARSAPLVLAMWVSMHVYLIVYSSAAQSSAAAIRHEGNNPQPKRGPQKRPLWGWERRTHPPLRHDLARAAVEAVPTQVFDPVGVLNVLAARLVLGCGSDRWRSRASVLDLASPIRHGWVCRWAFGRVIRCCRAAPTLHDAGLCATGNVVSEDDELL